MLRGGGSGKVRPEQVTLFCPGRAGPSFEVLNLPGHVGSLVGSLAHSRAGLGCWSVLPWVCLGQTQAGRQIDTDRKTDPGRQTGR